MSKLPEFLTIEYVAEYLKKAVGLSLSVETVIDYGRSGLLSFVVANKGGEATKLSCYRIDGEPCNDSPISILTKYPQITKSELERIADNTKPYRLDVVFNEVDGKKYEYMALPRSFYKKEDLRVAKDEVLRFATYLYEESVENELPFTSSDLFICLAKGNKFKVMSREVDHFIRKYMKLPNSHNELFDWLELKYSRDDGAVYIPDYGLITRENLRRRWGRWTGKKIKNPDH
jgi:hypothetical protein